jgi:uncharacterized membrane protein
MGCINHIVRVSTERRVVEMDEGHNLIVVTFEDDSKAYEALSRLKQAALAGRVGVRSAAVLDRDSNGQISVPEGGDAVIGAGFATGGLIGLLVGVLGGPVGVMLGFGVGALTGGLFDIDRADKEGDVLDRVAESVPVGRNALVAEVDEYAVEVIDGDMSALGGTVVRTPAAEVLTALESAEKAAKAAEREAARVMREERKQQAKAKLDEIEAKWDQRVDALKEKLAV